MSRALLLLAALVLGGCHAEPAPTSPPPRTPAGPPLTPDEQLDDDERERAGVPRSDCWYACGVLRDKQCEEGQPSKRARVSCTRVCEDSQGTGFALPAVCVRRARSVDEIRACGVRCGAR